MMKISTLFSMILLITSIAYSQEGIIRGSLVDFETGDPVIGAPVILKGTHQGTRSDINGKFILDKLTLGSTDLVVHGGSLIIMETGEESAQHNNYLNTYLRAIYLSQKNQQLDLGQIFLFSKAKSVEKTKCLQINTQYFPYQYSSGTNMIIVDFNNPLYKCLKQ